MFITRSVLIIGARIAQTAPAPSVIAPIRAFQNILTKKEIRGTGKGIPKTSAIVPISD